MTDQLVGNAVFPWFAAGDMSVERKQLELLAPERKLLGPRIALPNGEDVYLLDRLDLTNFPGVQPRYGQDVWFVAAKLWQRGEPYDEYTCKVCVVYCPVCGVWTRLVAAVLMHRKRFYKLSCPVCRKRLFSDHLSEALVAAANVALDTEASAGWLVLVDLIKMVQG